jgi:hypothetical protein
MKHTDAQRRRIFAMAWELSLDNDVLHDLVAGATGEAHISKLTVDQAGKVIEALIRMVERPRPGRLTPGQRKKILKLGYLLDWERRQIDGMCRRVVNVASMDWLTPRDAWKVTEAMKAMVKRREAEAGKAGGPEARSQRQKAP